MPAYFLARLLKADGTVGLGDSATAVGRDQNVFVNFGHSEILRGYKVAVVAALPAETTAAAGAFGLGARFVDGQRAAVELVPTQRAAMAFPASASPVISTKPKPLGWPVSRSVTMLTRSTAP